MKFSELLSCCEGKFGDKVSGYSKFGCNFIKADKSIFKEFLAFLKSEQGFGYLADIVAVHYPKKKDKFEVVYNLFAIEKKLRIFVKVAIETEKISTVTDIWQGADFLEREQYDLVGVVFEGHPNLQRILLPEFFDGHPLRKEYPLKGRKWFNNADEQNLGLKFNR